ncbi:VWA domain-containing protein [Brytella acorum]|uniref:VWA domain-containing protein n=1 Tax=Brytella acorum TaxID=2959299 RepID=A0AA35VA55_9PROT|nr:VWA domain-containing protein [Brytella acorum]MDF3623445.1 VWA domain-containing protein [Brytella acorum]CAI9120552.1 VWA domain-containing protein [Brytella acorum]
MNFMRNLAFEPLLPIGLLAAIVVVALALCFYGAARRARGMIWRLCAVMVLLCWLTGPRLLHPVLRPVPQDALLIVDHSPSMQIRDRQSVADATAARLRDAASRIPGLTLHTIIAHGGGGHGTRLFDAIQQADLPQGRFAGAIMLTDGMDHDAPDAIPERFRASDGSPLPLHVLLTGKGEETDRRLRILQAPPFAIVGQRATLRVEADDLGMQDHARPATLTVTEGDAPARHIPIVTGQPQDIDIPVRRPGEVLVGLSVSPLDGEVSDLNNQDVVRINGVRDRLKVLLVSGTPNQGERVWRSLLKADPSVDLVHFTILRPPDKDDGTPLSDLALIPFPITDLFQRKINDFDLIILDGFRNSGILPMEYLGNIARYVRRGGGLLLTAGPEFTEDGTLQDTPLGSVLPAHVPSDGVVIGRFQPQLTPLGRRHPITASLPDAPGMDGRSGGWGPWYRALRPSDHKGEVVMSGPGDQPLLLLDRVEKGRVALMLSDQLWLWSRGEGGGGPQAELLRRLSHWLMKEPELEENRLNAALDDEKLTITRHTASADTPPPAEVLSPDGRRQVVPLMRVAGQEGVFAASIPAQGIYGIWTVKEEGLVAFAAPPVRNPLERRDLRATAEVLRPLTASSKGSIQWVGDVSRTPELRQVEPGAANAGAGWIGFPRRMSQAVTEARPSDLLPAWAAMLLAMAFLFVGWRREGQR